MEASEPLQQLIRAIGAIRTAVHESHLIATTVAPSRSIVAETVPKRPRLDPSSLPRLESVIRAIHESVLREFTDHQRPSYARLLQAFEQTGIPLAGLSVCGMGTDEVVYTQLIRYFLDPREPHGLGAAALCALLDPEMGTRVSASAPPQWESAAVEAECSLGKTGTRPIESYLDIRIETPTTVVLIEHKIGSPESGTISGGEVSQLRRYSKAFASNFPELQNRQVLKIYLTPDGRAPREDRDWVPLAHREFARRLVPLLQRPDLSVVARHNLRCLLWDLASGPLAFDVLAQKKLCRYIRQALDEPSRYLRLRRWAQERSIDLYLLIDTLE